MDHIPTGAILLLLLVDLLVVVALSLSSALMVARAAGAPLWKAILIGLLVPIVGPFVWGAVVLAMDRGVADISRVQQRSPVVYAAAGGLLLAALMFLVGSLVPWARVSGSYGRRALSTDVSAVDTGAGMAGALMTVVVLVASMAIVLLWTVRRRVALVLTLVGSAWLLIAIDELIVFDAVDGISETVLGLSGGSAGADVAPELGLWLSLAGAVVMLGSALLLGFMPRELVAMSSPPAGPGTDPVLHDWGHPNDAWGAGPSLSTSSPARPDADYGDGY